MKWLVFLVSTLFLYGSYQGGAIIVKNMPSVYHSVLFQSLAFLIAVTLLIGAVAGFLLAQRQDKRVSK